MHADYLIHKMQTYARTAVFAAFVSLIIAFEDMFQVPLADSYARVCHTYPDVFIGALNYDIHTSVLTSELHGIAQQVPHYVMYFLVVKLAVHALFLTLQAQRDTLVFCQWAERVNSGRKHSLDVQRLGMYLFVAQLHASEVKQLVYQS